MAMWYCFLAALKRGVGAANSAVVSGCREPSAYIMLGKVLPLSYTCSPVLSYIWPSICFLRQSVTLTQAGMQLTV